MKTSIVLINLRIELTQETIKAMKGKISDYSKVMALKHSYELLKPAYYNKVD